jgi:hypothetical protein
MAPSYPVYREAAPAMRGLGWRAIIPIKVSSKAPSVPRGWPGEGGWAAFATRAPTDAEIAQMAAWAHPAAGIGLVCNGDFVCVDLDIRPKRIEANHDARLVAARDLTPRLVRLAAEILGFTPFMRRSDPPKAALLYAPESGADAITLDVGDDPVEIFGDPASGRQVVVYGAHPDAGTPYGWVAKAEPRTHGPEALPRVTAERLRAYHEAANMMAWEHPFMQLAPQKVRRAPVHRRTEVNMAASSGAIGTQITEVLRAIRLQGDRDPLDIARQHLREANERYHAMSGAVGALVICGYTDAAIIAALEGTYHDLFTADEVKSHMAAFYRSPAGLRRSMSRGQDVPLHSHEELDQILGVADWTPTK